MPTLEPDVHVFVIRARPRPSEIPGAPPEWRFWIEHHPGGEQHHYRDFAGRARVHRGYLPERRAARHAASPGEPCRDALRSAAARSAAHRSPPHPERSGRHQTDRRARRTSHPRGCRRLLREAEGDRHPAGARRARPRTTSAKSTRCSAGCSATCATRRTRSSVEVLHSARRMLELRAGDCDDMTILLGCAREVGRPSRADRAHRPRPAPARSLLAHLSRSAAPGRLDPARRHHAVRHGLVAARAGPPGALHRGGTYR